MRREAHGQELLAHLLDHVIIQPRSKHHSRSKKYPLLSRSGCGTRRLANTGTEIAHLRSGSSSRRVTPCIQNAQRWVEQALALSGKVSILLSSCPCFRMRLQFLDSILPLSLVCCTASGRTCHLWYLWRPLSLVSLFTSSILEHSVTCWVASLFIYFAETKICHSSQCPHIRALFVAIHLATKYARV